MKPAVYVDLKIQSQVVAQGLSIPVLGQAWNVVHGYIRLNLGHYAVALPEIRTGPQRHPGRVIRLFAETHDKLTALISAISGHSTFRDYLQSGELIDIPNDFSGAWREYRRYRITNRGSRLEKCREYRINQAAELPYLRTFSRSTGHSFGLYILPLEGKVSEDCQPDSYGLSVATRPFSLPVI